MSQSPTCCGRKMLAVASYKTHYQAFDRKQDTPVWWCAECHNKIKREEAN